MSFCLFLLSFSLFFSLFCCFLLFFIVFCCFSSLFSPPPIALLVSGVGASFLVSLISPLPTALRFTPALFGLFLGSAKSLLLWVEYMIYGYLIWLYLIYLYGCWRSKPKIDTLHFVIVSYVSLGNIKVLRYGDFHDLEVIFPVCYGWSLFGRSSDSPWRGWAAWAVRGSIPWFSDGLEEMILMVSGCSFSWFSLFLLYP